MAHAHLSKEQVIRLLWEIRSALKSLREARELTPAVEDEMLALVADLELRLEDK